MVECQLPKLKVASSILVARSNKLPDYSQKPIGPFNNARTRFI